LPESAIPFVLNKYQNTLLDELISKYHTNSFLISGIDRYDSNLDEYYNSMILINHYGEIVDSYDKTILTPFGEYIPWYSTLKTILQPIVGNGYGFTPGTKTRNIRLYLDEMPNAGISNTLIIMPMICFESIFTYVSKPRNYHEADVIINITNDSWFGKSVGPFQHLAMSRMRAIEYGLPLVRSATNGISAIFDCYGRSVQQIQLDLEGVIIAEMPEEKIETTYTKLARRLFNDDKI
jgi:apolipoprotein N-acyltransferase